MCGASSTTSTKIIRHVTKTHPFRKSYTACKPSFCQLSISHSDFRRINNQHFHNYPETQLQKLHSKLFFLLSAIYLGQFYSSIPMKCGKYIHWCLGWLPGGFRLLCSCNSYNLIKDLLLGTAEERLIFVNPYMKDTKPF